jgi:multiple sugar transport system permease protein
MSANRAGWQGARSRSTSHVRLLGSNYQTVLADPQIKMSLFAWNSVFICVCVVALQLTTSSLAAFAFARLEWPWRDRIFIAYLGTLMIPGVVTQIPNYIILQKLGWLNTFWGLIVPASASAFGTFMLRQYMLTLPKGLEEAARIDGAGTLRIWWTIILPLCKPALITLAIFTFATTWQSFTWPLVVAPAEEVRVLPVALRNFSNDQKTAYNLLMAASLVMMGPMILLFLFGQKYFIRGVQVGGHQGMIRLQQSSAVAQAAHPPHIGSCGGAPCGKRTLPQRWTRFVAAAGATGTRTMAEIKLIDWTRSTTTAFKAVKSHQPAHPRPRVHGPGRALRLRQDHHPAHDRRARGHHLAARSASVSGGSTMSSRRIATSPWCSRTTRSTRT